MALITLEEAAARTGAARETIEEWVKSGLLAVQERPRPASSPPGDLGRQSMEKCVDEEELFDVAENMGWLELSSENWDDDEDK
jgi:hypothetical protein